MHRKQFHKMAKVRQNSIEMESHIQTPRLSPKRRVLVSRAIESNTL